MNNKPAWGIIGTGSIARVFAQGLAASKIGELLAVGSRSQESAERFGEELDVPRRYGSYEALLADAEVQVVYISTPHAFHAEWAIKAAEAGKHVLCEKPLALNYPEAMAVVEAVIRHDVFLMEAFMYRCHPQTAKLVNLLREGAIGDVHIIQATFGFDAGFNPEGRLLKNTLGGGGILDVGCYCTSMARLVAGVAMGGEFAEPIEVKGVGHIGSTGVDEYAVATLKFPGDIVALLATSVRVNQENVVRLFGSQGYILIPSPWQPGRDAGTSKILVHRNDESAPREIVIESDAGLYTIEAETVAANIDRRQAPFPAVGWDDTLGNMKTLDQWREAIGMMYEAEKPEAWVLPVSRRPLAVRKDHNMKYERIPGLAKSVSRLVMGTVAMQSIPYASVMYDDFVERGGNCFDSAFIYGNGACEKMLGQWIKNRNIREQVVIFDKGAHTPFCNPENLTRQLLESLQRLQTDYTDIYMLHRDNPKIPVEEFIDVLNEHKEAGRIRVFGASNWTLQRIEAANAYAQAKGLSGFVAISNQFSLARMLEPMWEGVVSATDPESRAWFSRTQMPLMAWSSQAHGFFVRGHPENLSEPELVRCWYSQDNFLRLERAKEMADRLGVLPTNIALAYALSQPFPTFAIFGPETLAQTCTAIPALDIALTPNEVRWLNLET
jgi:predicted dehydrogenase/aryl-alcohol dehydrogenase-like predicted oxidoreductase